MDGMLRGLISRLHAEGVTKQNITLDKAIKAVEGCVSAHRIIKYLKDNYSEVIKKI